MITVRFFGMVRLQTKIASISAEANDINELLKEICNKISDVKIETLKNSVIYVNGKNIINMNLFKTKLNKNDEVQILSPISGG